jgi:hypothetical protein
VKIGISRRKKQSAIDTAILAIRAEERLPATKAIVASLKDRILKIEWSSPPNGALPIGAGLVSSKRPDSQSKVF